MDMVNKCAINLTLETHSNCISLDDCNGTGNCKILHISGMATNYIGSSGVRTSEILIAGNYE